ncbi:MAG: GNAT family N-acetyltransferase [Candidatus Omnitrophica bacterium]|nr:GNAT family N-acetyltransferase [Candidatus Omnitrophota bacterium]
MITVREINTESEFRQLRDAWEDAISRSNNHHCLFLSWEWLYSWWRVYGDDGRTLFILVARDDDGVLLGIAPLLLRRATLFGLKTWTVLEFLGSGEDPKEKVCSEYLDFIVCRGREEEVMKAFFAYLGEQVCRWDVFSLESVLEYSHAVRFLHLLEKQHALYIMRCSNNGQGYNYMSLTGSWEDLLQSYRASGRCLYTAIRRKRRALETCGTIEIGEVRDENELDAVMDRLIHLHQLKWNAVGKPGSFRSERFTRFHRTVAPLLLKKGRLILPHLKVNGTIQACMYVFTYNGRSFYYQTGYNPHFPSKFSPGFTLFTYFLERSVQRGTRELEFLRGECHYKNRWSGQKRRVYELLITRKEPGGMFFIARTRAERAIRGAARKLLRENRPVTARNV